MALNLRIPIAAGPVLLGYLSLLASAQTGSVSFAPALTVPTILYASAITAGDLDHRGKAALGVAAATDDDQITCIAPHPLAMTYPDWVGHGYSPMHFDCDFFSAYYSGSILFADADGDGNLDVITTDAEGSDIAISLGNSQGQFDYGNGISLNFSCGDNTPVQAAVADMNGDGIPDLVAIYGTGYKPRGCVAVFLGQGDRGFAPPIGTTAGVDVPHNFAVGDLNPDGFPDLVIANSESAQGPMGNLAVLLGKGDGGFGPPAICAHPSPFARVVLGDFDGDGSLDLSFTDNQTLRVALGTGDGRFVATHAYRLANGAGDTAAADFNGDGILDLVSTFSVQPSGGVAVLLGNGDGTFQPEADFTTDENPAVAIGDFNGDGKPDIATVNGPSTLSILLNTTPWPKAKK